MAESPKLKGMALRGLERAATTHLQSGITPQEHLKKLLARDSYKQERLSAGINLVGYAVPGFEEFLAKALTKKDKLPFKNVDPSLFFRSGENSIFLIREDEKSSESKELKVLKINHNSMSSSTEKLLEVANRISGEYKKIKSWYADVPGLVPDESSLILHSHLLGKPAVATIQPFLSGEKRGIFEDYTVDELVEKLESDQQLKDNFITFGRKLTNIYDETGECIDLPGERNVVIIEDKGKSSLVLLDPHVIYSPERLRSSSPTVTKKLQERVNHLKSILSKVEEKPVSVEQSIFLEQEVDH